MLETAYIADEEKSYMAFSGLPDKFHFYGISDTWAPTTLCLREILIRSQFEPVMEESWSAIPPLDAALKQGQLPIGRITMIAKAVSDEKMHRIDRLKVKGVQ
ncbi:MAG: hypothetical protein R3C58_02685 [Parvularculaceae bacterium]